MNARTRKSAIKHASTRKNGLSRASSHLVPALIVAGMATPLHALELGQIKVESALGQPLRASIAYALNPTEELYDYCVSINRGNAVSDLPELTKAKISVVGNQIILNGSVPIMEPLLSMRMTVNCPYTVNLSREYLLMIDPVGTTEKIAESSVASIDPPVAKRSEQVSVRRSSSVRAEGRSNTSPVPMGREYRVQIGDSLSSIVSRIQNRTMGLWPAVDAVFHANPDAFVDGDMNRLQAGSILLIPNLEGRGTAVADRSNVPARIESQAGASQTSAATSELNQSMVDQSFETESQYSGYTAPIAGTESEDFSPGALESGPIETTEFPEGISISAAEDTSVLSSGVVADIDSLKPADSEKPVDEIDKVATAKPGDLFVGGDVPADASVIAGDALPLQPVGISTAESKTDGLGLTAWLAGTGLVLITALLLFGRRLRERFGGAPTTIALSAQNRRRTDPNTAVQDDAQSDLDFEFENSVTGKHSIILDADLGIGTGLQSAADIHVAQDFGFSASDSDEDVVLDLEIPAEHGHYEKPETDIIPPMRVRQETILDSEIPPSDDSQYDLSMITDATKHNLDDMRLTAKDLMAIQLPSEKFDDSNVYTLNREVDFKVLEQDYEDELSATQVLNLEIEKAARELAVHMSKTNSSDETADMPVIDNELTAEMPARRQVNETPELASEIESQADNTVELTAELPTNSTAENDDFISDLDDTGLNEELTTEMEFDDNYAEITIESGTIDTKKIAY